jgi:hypothetical protein
MQTNEIILFENKYCQVKQLKAIVLVHHFRMGDRTFLTREEAFKYLGIQDPLETYSFSK